MSNDGRIVCMDKQIQLQQNDFLYVNHHIIFRKHVFFCTNGLAFKQAYISRKWFQSINQSTSEISIIYIQKCSYISTTYSPEPFSAPELSIFRSQRFPNAIVLYRTICLYRITMWVKTIHDIIRWTILKILLPMDSARNLLKMPLLSFYHYSYCNNLHENLYIFF